MFPTDRLKRQALLLDIFASHEEGHKHLQPHQNWFQMTEEEIWSNRHYTVRQKQIFHLH